MMIQIHIITKEPEKVKEIAELLINEELITGVTVIDTLSSYKSEQGKIETVLTNLLIGRTKASLFSTIEKLLQDKYGERVPAIYGMPIINMDIKHLEKLKKVVKEEVLLSNN